MATVLYRLHELACPGDSAVYRCNVSGADPVSWTWTSSSINNRYSVVPGFTEPGIVNQSIFNTPVQFSLTDVGPPFTNIIATLFSPQQLKGITMTCGGQQLTIHVPKPRSKFLIIVRQLYIKHQECIILYLLWNSLKSIFSSSLI